MSIMAASSAIASSSTVFINKWKDKYNKLKDSYTKHQDRRNAHKSPKSRQRIFLSGKVGNLTHIAVWVSIVVCGTNIGSHLSTETHYGWIKMRGFDWFPNVYQFAF
ncbi:uncharacterized protein LOC129895772 [Solanum dulcamara]|uniref:uncharacterized protein LOC129895772 n=1 Tax=Solanum dulcamara TaxID=45834 RepID=UPI002484FF87|nr:uncharacterized protein LOC129895772 [Solanum dulcamara]